MQNSLLQHGVPILWPPFILAALLTYFLSLAFDFEIVAAGAIINDLSATTLLSLCFFTQWLFGSLCAASVFFFTKKLNQQR